MILSKEALIDETLKNIESYYDDIKYELETPYISTEFDFLREEICKCLIFRQNQAAITLTNHLVEYFLKTMLEFENGLNQDNNISDLGEKFKESVEKYDNINLDKSINIACSKGIIDKEDKKELVKFKIKYRNPYSHSIKAKILGEDSLMGFSVNLNPQVGENPFSQPKEYKIKDSPQLHGLFQQIKADKEALDYFKSMDKIIRKTLMNFQY